MKDFVLITPEFFLALTLIFVLVGEITYFGERTRLLLSTAILGLIAAFSQVIMTYQYGAAQLFAHSFAIDGLSLFFKLLFILLAALAILASVRAKEIPKTRHAEYFALVIGSVLSMCIASSAADLLLTFLSLQAMNILHFFISGYGKRSPKSAEAAVKYMIFSMVAGGFFLYGLAILYGNTHSLNIYEIQQVLLAHPLPRESTLVVFMLLFFSLAFQMSVFPNYLWAPDVLEGAPTPASGFLAVGSRAAGFAVAIRILFVIFAQPSLSKGEWTVLGGVNWPSVMATVAGISMLVGSLLAFRQESAKRLVSCLVVAESGYLLMGLLVMDEVGVSAVLYNLAAQLFALMGIFYVLSFIFDEVRSDRLEDLKGMLNRAVPECICLILFLLCLIGFPPLPGFLGKFALIGTAIRHEWYVLAIVAILSGALATISVARLAFSLIGNFRRPSGPVIAPRLGRNLYLMLLVAPMALIGIFADFVLNWTGRSLGFIFW